MENTKKPRICAITSSRADYGLLSPVMRKILTTNEYELQVIATGTHLVNSFGYTLREIESDGFRIDRSVEIFPGGDSVQEIGRSMSLCLRGVVSALQDLSPDLVILLGDRFEIFAAAQSAMLCHIPIAHIGGGDTGLGTYDNIIRHCITKIAALHFVTHKEAHNRVLQLGENPAHVFNVGSTCVENIRKLALLDRFELAKFLGVALKDNIYVVTYHPLTMTDADWRNEFVGLLAFLKTLASRPDTSVVITKSNADEGGSEVNRAFEIFVNETPSASLFDSLGHLNYLSIVRQARAVIGNSSSGLYEAPYLGTPTIDVGLRQKGRMAPESVIRSDGSPISLDDALHKAENLLMQRVPMVFGDGTTSDQIIAILRDFGDFKRLKVKNFHDRALT